jgi:hypothetical protein
MRAVKDGQNMEESYYVGIIDILMLYSLRKRGEHAYKSLRFGKVKKGGKMRVTGVRIFLLCIL